MNKSIKGSHLIGASVIISTFLRGGGICLGRLSENTSASTKRHINTAKLHECGKNRPAGSKTNVQNGQNQQRARGTQRHIHTEAGNTEQVITMEGGKHTGAGSKTAAQLRKVNFQNKTGNNKIVND